MNLTQWYSENQYHERFVYIRQEHVDFFNIILCGITLPNASYDIDWREQGAPCHIYNYVRSGHGTIEDENGIRRLSAGDLLFMPRKKPLRLRADPADPFETVWIQTTGTLMKGLCDLYGMNSRIIVRQVPAEAQFGRIVSLLSRSTPATTLRDLSACSVAVMEMTAALMHTEVFGDRESAPDALSARIRCMLDSALYTPVTLEEIADTLHLTPTHVIRVFRSAYGTTPKKYLSERRLSQAKILLGETEIPIHEIAESLCYSDTHHFAAVFRRAVGCSPSEYRKQTR